MRCLGGRVRKSARVGPVVLSVLSEECPWAWSTPGGGHPGPELVVCRVWCAGARGCAVCHLSGSWDPCWDSGPQTVSGLPS